MLVVYAAVALVLSVDKALPSTPPAKYAQRIIVPF